MKIGYARVSSSGQNLETQISKLTKFGCEKIFQEKKSWRSSKEREGVQDAIEFCREGDILVVTKLDRLARSMFDLQKIIAVLERKKVEFVVLDQKIDTTTPTGRLTFHLLWAVAEFERDLINERRDEWMAAAKARGVKFGRKSKLTEAQIEELREAKRKWVETRDLMKLYGISKTTVNRLCQQPKPWY